MAPSSTIQRLGSLAFLAELVQYFPHRTFEEVVSFLSTQTADSLEAFILPWLILGSSLLDFCTVLKSR